MSNEMLIAKIEEELEGIMIKPPECTPAELSWWLTGMNDMLRIARQILDDHKPHPQFE